MLTSKKKLGLLVIGVLVVAIAAWQIYKYRLINSKVARAVTEKTKGLYDIRYEQLSLDEAAGELHVKNIVVTPDTALYRQMEKDEKDRQMGNLPSILLKVQIPALDILGVKTPKALLTRQVEGRKIEIANPTIEILLTHFKKDTTVYNPAKDLSKELLGKLRMIGVDSVSLLHAKVIVRDMRTGQIVLKGAGISCLLSQLLIDSLSVKDSSRVLFSRDLELACEEMQFPSKNKKYRFEMTKLRFNSRQDALHIGQFKIKPMLGEAEFAASFATQKDRYDFTFEGVSFLHVDRKALWHKRIEADSLVIKESSFKIYHDRSYPGDTISKVGNYPQQQLMRVPVPIRIGEIVFLHSFIEYKEKNPKTDSAGKLQFFDVRASLSNVTNRKVVAARNNNCILLFRAKFLNKAPVDAKLVMRLNDRKGRFTIEGNIGPFDVPDLNPLTQPMGLARMEKGHVKKVSFNFRGDDSSCKGPVTMLYDGLKVSLLKKDKDENKYDKKQLASLITNVMAKNANPSKDGEDPRIAEVEFERVLTTSFFSLIWKSLFTGIKETAGVK